MKRMKGILSKIIMGLLFIILLLICCSNMSPEANAYTYSETYYTIDEYLSGYSKDEVTTLDINGIWIGDYSGLNEYTNLREINIRNTALLLEGIDFSGLEKLEKVYISNVTSAGKLNFSNDINLKSITIWLDGDITRTCIDIRRM